LPLDWTQLDYVINELVKTHPNLAGIKQAAPEADFRISGLKIAREPRRYSGRTAMRANLSVHEPMQPKDLDTGLTFSMEGYSGTQTPGSMIPFAQAPGWNSPQAWNKYQDKVGGSLKQGDPGIRLFDLIDDAKKHAKRDYIRPELTQPIKTSIFQGQAKLVPVHNLYGGSPMAHRSPVIAEQMQQPAFYIGVEDGEHWQVSNNDWLAVTVDGQRVELPVVIVPYLAEGCIGYPVGQVPILHGHLPASVTKIDRPKSMKSAFNNNKPQLEGQGG